MGGGPRLLTNGKLTVYPEYEGFSHPKILSLSCQRSAVGVSKDGKWLILATTQGTMRQLGDVMWAIGCHQAMSLDGGASSGLWVRGHYLTTPERKISNALLVVKRKEP
jgi:exopolysaccharide biosynthesis protein